MNKVFLVGNSGVKAELKYLPNKTPVTSINLAVHKGIKNADGSWGEGHTNWFRCVVFGERAVSIAPMVDKGTKLMVLGELSSREWVNKEGQKRTSTDIIVNEIHVIEKNKPAPTQPLFPDDNEDLPF